MEKKRHNDFHVYQLRYTIFFMSSAYGPARPRLVRPTLPSTVWKCSTDSEKNHISVHHLTIDTARTLPGLIPFLADAFALEINTGRTYPQEEDIFIGTGSGTSTEVVPAFEAYFFAGDVFIGVFDKVPASTVEGDMIAGGLNELCPDHNWEDCIAGFFYVSFIAHKCDTKVAHHLHWFTYHQIKPNYPGRSSHVSLTDVIRFQQLPF